MEPLEVSSLIRFIADICAGTLETTVGNASTIIVSCGLVYGAARRANGDASLVFEPNSEWTVPIHSCATAVRATVKTVEFYINGTTFNDLKVNSIATKQYPNNDSMPLWGVETSGMRLGDATPLWGMIDPALATKNVTAKRAERLYLPGHLKSTGIIPLLNGGLDYQNL